MIIESGKTFLMFKIMSPPGISFLDEHQKMISKRGYVWFCRFGRTNLVLKSISKDGNYVFVKESIKNGNKKYVLEFSDISNEAPTSGYPAYYSSVAKEASLWFKVTSITELPDDFESYFCAASSNNSLESVYRSMCSSFYIRSNKALRL